MSTSLQIPRDKQELQSFVSHFCRQENRLLGFIAHSVTKPTKSCKHANQALKRLEPPRLESRELVRRRHPHKRGDPREQVQETDQARVREQGGECQTAQPILSNPHDIRDDIVLKPQESQPLNVGRTMKRIIDQRIGLHQGNHHVYGTGEKRVEEYLVFPDACAIMSDSQPCSKRWHGRVNVMRNEVLDHEARHFDHHSAAERDETVAGQTLELESDGTEELRVPWCVSISDCRAVEVTPVMVIPYSSLQNIR